MPDPITLFTPAERQARQELEARATKGWESSVTDHPDTCSDVWAVESEKGSVCVLDCPAVEQEDAANLIAQARNDYARLLAIEAKLGEAVTFLSTIAHPMGCPSIDDPTICTCGLAILLAALHVPPTEEPRR